MWEFISKHWTAINEVSTLVLLLASILVAAGFFVRRKRHLRELLYVEQERDNLASRLADARVRLSKVDPERFIDLVGELREAGKWDELEKVAFAFSDRQSEAFGLAAEILVEQRILDSGESGETAIAEAKRFASIGMAANPESPRLAELAKLAERRAEALARGEPLETLNWDGISDVELNRLCLALVEEGQYALAEIAARRSVPLAAFRTGTKSANFGGALGAHAQCLRRLADFDGAEQLYVKSTEVMRSAVGERDLRFAQCLDGHAGVMEDTGRYIEAEPLFRKALEITRDVLGEKNKEYAICLNNLAGPIRRAGRLDEAETLLRQALDIRREVLGETHSLYAHSLSNLAQLLILKDGSTEAEAMLRQAAEISRKSQGEAHPDFAVHLCNLADLLKRTGRRARAIPLYRQALATFEAGLPEGHPLTQMARRTLETSLAEDADG